MDRVAKGFLGIAVLISLIQTLHAISEDEYNRKTAAIKSKPEIESFLKNNEFVLSQYGVFFDKLADMFTHVRKTKAGSEMMDHVWNETETVLKHEKTYGFIKSILAAARQVLLSDVGRANLFAVAEFIQDELQIPKLFEMCLSLKKIILYILLSENGLTSLRKVKENNFVLETKPDTAPLMKMLNDDFPILSLPTGLPEADDKDNQTNDNVLQMKSMLSKMEGIKKQ